MQTTTYTPYELKQHYKETQQKFNNLLNETKQLLKQAKGEAMTLFKYAMITSKSGVRVFIYAFRSNNSFNDFMKSHPYAQNITRKEVIELGKVCHVIIINTWTASQERINELANSN
jgi:hypothetical protein